MMDESIWIFIAGTIFTILCMIVGFAYTVGMFKGKFTSEMKDHCNSIDQINIRLEEGQKTFIEIRENISAQTESLKSINKRVERLEDIRNNIK